MNQKQILIWIKNNKNNYQIKPKNNIIEKIILGQDAYLNKAFILPTQTSDFYKTNNFDEIAFFTKTNNGKIPRPTTLISVLSILFGSLKKVDNILTALEKHKYSLYDLAMYLFYVKKTILINRDDGKNNSITSYFNNFVRIHTNNKNNKIQILFLGNTKSTYHLNYLNKNNIDYLQTYHPSGQNFSLYKIKYCRVYFQYQTILLTKSKTTNLCITDFKL